MRTTEAGIILLNLLVLPATVRLSFSNILYFIFVTSLTPVVLHLESSPQSGVGWVLCLAMDVVG